MINTRYREDKFPPIYQQDYIIRNPLNQSRRLYSLYKQIKKGNLYSGHKKKGMRIFRAEDDSQNAHDLIKRTINYFLFKILN